MSEILLSRSDEILSEYDRLREDAILLDFDRWSLFELRGDDRKAWLQGQVTNDLRSFISGSSSSFCMCRSTGQIEAIIDGWALQDRFCLACQTEEAAEVARRVEEMVILENVELENVSSQYRLLSIQGPRATARLSEVMELPSLDAGVANVGEHAIRVLRSDRTGSGGWDLWIPATADAFANRLMAEVGAMGQDAYEIVRLEAGIPKSGVDYDKRTLPPELGARFTFRHVSYTKGCYTGQEVLMRIHSRGHTNRCWVGLQLKDLPVAGSAVAHRLRGEVGTVTSSVFSPDYGPIATAWVKNDFKEPGEELIVQSDGVAIEAEVRPLPFLTSP